MPFLRWLRLRAGFIVAVLVASAALAACGDDDTESGEEAEDSLTVEQVMDFTTSYHEETPFLSPGGDEPLLDCSWITDEEVLRNEAEAYGAESANAFLCSSDSIEEGDLSVVVIEFADEASVQEEIDGMLSGDTALVDGTVLVSGPPDDMEAIAFYDALIKECGCGEVFGP